jgi:branched-chain amino acid transport system substrate-binding protein
LLVGDDGYEPDKAVDGTLKMLDDGVFSLFGYVGTPTSNAVIPIVKDSHVPLVGLFTGANSLRKPVTPEIVNVRSSYDDEAETLVDHFVKDLGAKKIAVFYQEDGFGQAVLSGTEKALKKRGMEVAAKGTFQRNTVAVQSGLASVMAANPDVVVMVGPYTPVAAFAKDARKQGLKAHLATVSFVGSNSLLAAAGAAGDGIIISQVVPFPGDTSIPVVKECGDLVSKYAPGESLGFVNLEGCISAKIMVMGLDKAGKDLTRVGLIKALESIQNVDMGGVNLNISADDHQALHKVYLTQIRGDKIVPITAIAK